MSISNNFVSRQLVRRHARHFDDAGTIENRYGVWDGAVPFIPARRPPSRTVSSLGPSLVSCQGQGSSNRGHGESRCKRKETERAVLTEVRCWACRCGHGRTTRMSSDLTFLTAPSASQARFKSSILRMWMTFGLSRGISARSSSRLSAICSVTPRSILFSAITHEMFGTCEIKTIYFQYNSKCKRA